MHTYTYVYIYIYTYIHIDICRERERQKHTAPSPETRAGPRGRLRGCAGAAPLGDDVMLGYVMCRS